MFNRKRGNYLLVCHVWHVQSYGFYTRTLLDVTKREAQGEAALLAEEHRGTCRSSCGEAMLLPDTIQVIHDKRRS